jgi:hypothetical protein
MAVAIEMEFDGMSVDQYNEVLEKMGLERGGDTPAGALFHWCSVTDGGLHIVDVWETREAFDQFAQEQIGPHSAAVGFEGQPQMTFYEVENHFIRTS